MSVKNMDAAELLSINKYNVDDEQAHILLDKTQCTKCQDKTCLLVCPAVLYRLDKNGEISFDYAGCLECGTCRIMCQNKGIVRWVYPRGTFGVSFRFG